MKWENFKECFHESYHNKMRPFIESEHCDKIYKSLKESSQRGKKIAPLSNLTYRCFQETPLNDVKVIIVGMCPYHTFIKNEPVADGLALSCSITGKLQPSLEKFYEGVENDLFNGLNLNYYKSPDLSYLAKQGVLLFNAALTTEKDKAGSHLELWAPFTKYVLSEVFGYSGIPVIFLGKDAGRFQKDVTVFTHNFVLDHPAFAARINSTWDTKNAFKKVSEIIWQNNGYKINWLLPKEEIEEYDIPF